LRLCRFFVHFLKIYCSDAIVNDLNPLGADAGYFSALSFIARSAIVASFLRFTLLYIKTARLVNKMLSRG
jgi:hypothetical protein